MAFAPVEYGPQTAPDTEGLAAERQAVAQHEAVFHEARQLGAVIEGGSAAITQGILHTQSLKATAAVKERQAQTLQFIDSNPYVDKTTLQQRMAKEDYEAWHATLSPEYKDATTVPMYSAAGALFDSEAKTARADSGQIISLPGWRGAWEAAEQSESSTIRERYVNRMAADQMIADHRYQTLQTVDKMVDAAVKPEDIQAAAVATQTSPWLKPAERKYIMEKTMAAKDSFVARQAMLAGDTEVMKFELDKLRSDKSADYYPNMNVRQRIELANQLSREHVFKFSKDAADAIVGKHVDENGKVDSTGIANDLAAYKGEHPEDVTRAVKAEEAAKVDIFSKSMADVASIVQKAGRNSLTGRFDYALAMRDPAARKAAAQLNNGGKIGQDMITALSKEDARWDSIDSRVDAAERRQARAELIAASEENLRIQHKRLDDPAMADELHKLTEAQYDTQLYNVAMTEPDRNKLRVAFREFQKRGGKPDERVATIVNSEVLAAANGDQNTSKRLMAVYGDRLREAANIFIRAHPELPPDEMSTQLRAHLKGEMTSGVVVGSSKYLPDETATRIKWETDPRYAGKAFQTKTGGLLDPSVQRIHLTKGNQSGTFSGVDAAAAIADGWK